MTDKLTFSRRDGIKALLAISAAGALSACKARESSGDVKAAKVSLNYASEGAFFEAKELTVLAALAQTIIPKTETGGAVEAGVPEVLQRLVSDWGDDNLRSYWRGGLTSLAGELHKLAGQGFEKTSEARRLSLLKKYDANEYSGVTKNEFYRDMKETIGTAYYMSELGATEELHYEAVPGDFKGDVLFSEIGKAWAT